MARPVFEPVYQCKGYGLFLFLLFFGKRLIGSAMFGATFKLIARVELP